jgi:hypothetical protein
MNVGSSSMSRHPSNAAWPRGNPRTLGRVVRALDGFLAAHASDTALQGRIEWLSGA